MLAKPRIERHLNLVIGDDDIQETQQTQTNRKDEKEIVRDIDYFSTSSNLKHVKDKLLLDKKLKKFELKMRENLDIIDKCLNDDESNVETLFIFVMQSFEDYIHTDADVKDKLKRELIPKLMRKIVPDEKLALSIMNLVQRNIKKSTFYRRNKKKIYKAFIFFKDVSQDYLNYIIYSNLHKLIILPFFFSIL